MRSSVSSHTKLPARTVLSRPVIAGWRMTAREIAQYNRYVGLDTTEINGLLPWLAPGPPNEAWRNYVSLAASEGPDLGRLYYELALTISQFGGFVGYKPDGDIDVWKHGGSGVKAILATMDAIRRDAKLPGIDIHSDYDRQLAHYFINVPFGSQRLAMLKELASPSARHVFSTQLASARRADGSYCFNALHMAGLAAAHPLSFGQDPPFLKKAALLLMTMEIALNQLGGKAVALIPPAADYRLPQILEGLGVLRFDAALESKIQNGHVFGLRDPEVCAIRAMTIEAIGHIKLRYEDRYGLNITCAELDGRLYLLSRNHQLMTRASMKPHILVATAAF